jgi:hypothetical protein
MWRDRRAPTYAPQTVSSFDAKRTQVAQSAFNFANYFTDSFSRTVVGGSVPRRPVLSAPEGMSTGGGRQARQAVMLVSDSQQAPAVTVGWVEMPTRKGAIRSYRCLAALHEARFRGRPFDVDVASYQAFMGQVQSFFDACGLEVTVEDDVPVAAAARPSNPPAVEASEPSDPNRVMTLAAVALVSFALGVSVGGLAIYARYVGF